MSQSISLNETFSIIQSYLDSFQNNDILKDKCTFAARVNIINGNDYSKCFLSIVHNETYDQSALFLFPNIPNTEVNKSDLCLMEILCLDETFQCEPDSRGRLFVIGKSLMKNLPKFLCPIQIVTPVSGVSEEPISSDVDSDEFGGTNLANLKFPNYQKRTIQFTVKLSSFTLEFEQPQQAIQFQDCIIRSTDMRKVPVRQRVTTSNDYNDTTADEHGEETVPDVAVPKDRQSWLFKYVDISKINNEQNYSSESIRSLIQPQYSNLVIVNNVNKFDSSSQDMKDQLNSTSPDRNILVHTNTILRSSTTDIIDNNNSEINSLGRRSNSAIYLDDGSVIPSGLDINYHGADMIVDHNFPKEPRSLFNAHSCSDIAKGSALLKNHTRRKSKGFLEPPKFRVQYRQATKFMQDQLIERVEEYSTVERVRVYIGTWNVNGRLNSNQPLDDWLLPPEGQPPADIYVFGFQEVDLSLSVVTLNKTNPSGVEDRWVQQLEEALDGFLRPPDSSQMWLNKLTQKSKKINQFSAKWSKHVGGGYVRLQRVRMAGIIMIVYMSAKLYGQGCPDEIYTQIVPTGVFNMMGNKGAVGLRLTLFNSSLCFINCHLAAGQGNLDRRNQDYREIVRKMVFDLSPNVKYGLVGERFMVSNHDIIFIFGDLNYRIDGLESVAVRDLVTKQDYQQLLKYDELCKQKKTRIIFDGFKEHQITFPPTYKFDANTNNYDTSEKNRVPSYCDRILWFGKSCKPICYRSHSTYVSSDHKPVSAYFTVGLYRFNSEKFQHTYEALMRCQDSDFNLSLPQAKLDSQDIDFGCVHFHELRSKSVTLTNTGRYSFQYRFGRDGPQIFPPWLTVSPLTETVKPGASVQINFEVFINQKEIHGIYNGDSMELSTILILNLHEGKDFFITTRCQFIPTSFGLSLELLLSLKQDPVAKIPITELKERIKNSRKSSENVSNNISTDQRTQPFRIPKEIFRLVNFINEHITESDLFRQFGSSADVDVIRDVLDTTPVTCPFPDTVSVHSVVFCLFLFLNALPEPVIPTRFQTQCLNSCTNLNTAIQALSRLPIVHQNLFHYLITFMQRCLSLNKQNGTDVNLIVNSFGDIFFSNRTTNAAPTSRKPLFSPRLEDRASFVRIFVSNTLSDVR